MEKIPFTSPSSAAPYAARVPHPGPGVNCACCFIPASRGTETMFCNKKHTVIHAASVCPKKSTCRRVESVVGVQCSAKQPDRILHASNQMLIYGTIHGMHRLWEVWLTWASGVTYCPAIPQAVCLTACLHSHQTFLFRNTGCSKPSNSKAIYFHSSKAGRIRCTGKSTLWHTHLVYLTYKHGWHVPRSRM